VDMPAAPGGCGRRCAAHEPRRFAMDAVLSALAIYVFLLVVLRIGGKRTLGQTTTFDFVLVLIIAETTQQALLGDDFSVTNALLLIATLVGLDIALSLLKRKWPKLDRLIEGVPM